MGELTKDICQYCYKKPFKSSIVKFNNTTWKVCDKCSRDSSMHLNLILEIPFEVSTVVECNQIIYWLIGFIGDEYYIVKKEILAIATIDLLHFWLFNQKLISGSKCELFLSELIESANIIADETKDLYIHFLINRIYAEG